MTQSLPCIDTIDIANRRVLLRVDFNVPMQDGIITDDLRILSALPTIEYARQAGARIVLASHLGRPNGKPTKRFSLEPIGQRLAELLDTSVLLTDEPVGDGARKVVSELKEKEIALLENLRFHPGEESNSPEFAKELAEYADIYVNDAFGTAHRRHASTVGVPSLVGTVGMGFLMAKELDFLSSLQSDTSKRPYVAVLGGAKVSDKVPIIESLVEKIDVLLVGGAMANTLLAAKGIDVGASRVETDKLDTARAILRRAFTANVKVVLPQDAIFADKFPSIGDGTTGQAGTWEIAKDRMALDIGPQTAQEFSQHIANANTVFWNGPMGVCEHRAYAKGTDIIGQAMASNTTAVTVIGGGDSAAAARHGGYADAISHISTGGGASLQYLQGKNLAAIDALQKSHTIAEKKALLNSDTFANQ